MSRNIKYEQYHWPSRLNPGFDDEKDREMQYLYGGKDSPGYVHNVLGLHGSPEHSVFDIKKYLACVRDIPHLHIVAGATEEIPKIESPKLPDELRNEVTEFYLGCDLGFAQDPSELVVWAVAGDVLYNIGRIHLQHVDYSAQQQVIQMLDDQFGFTAVGIDNGHSGCAVAHNLMSISHQWARKVVQVPFGGAVWWDSSADGMVAKRFVKELTTEILIRLMGAGQIVFPPLADRLQQYAGHTYCIAPSGRMVFAKGNDHIIDADRCAIMAIKRDLLQPTGAEPSLLAPRVAFF
jgi:hypothetical protein